MSSSSWASRTFSAVCLLLAPSSACLHLAVTRARGLANLRVVANSTHTCVSPRLQLSPALASLIEKACRLLRVCKRRACRLENRKLPTAADTRCCGAGCDSKRKVSSALVASKLIKLQPLSRSFLFLSFVQSAVSLIWWRRSVCSCSRILAFTEPPSDPSRRCPRHLSALAFSTLLPSSNTPSDSVTLSRVY